MTREEKFAFLLLTLRKGGRRGRKGKCLSFLAPEISMGERGEKKGKKGAESWFSRKKRRRNGNPCIAENSTGSGGEVRGGLSSPISRKRRRHPFFPSVRHDVPTNERDFAQRRKMKGRKIKLFKFRACAFPHPLLYEVEGGRGGGGRVVVLLGHRVVHALLDHPLEKRGK